MVCWHHVYQSVWTSTVGENLFTASDKWEEALSYDEFAIDVYKDEKSSLLVGHLTIEISRLSYHFLKKSSENKIIENYGKKGKRNWFSSPSQLGLRFILLKIKTVQLFWSPNLRKEKHCFKIWNLSFMKKVYIDNFRFLWNSPN